MLVALHRGPLPRTRSLVCQRTSQILQNNCSYRPKSVSWGVILVSTMMSFFESTGWVNRSCCKCSLMFFEMNATGRPWHLVLVALFWFCFSWYLHRPSFLEKHQPMRSLVSWLGCELRKHQRCRLNRPKPCKKSATAASKIWRIGLLPYVMETPRSQEASGCGNKKTSND